MERVDVALIGRGAEIGRLDSALARLRQGSGGAVLIAGEAGIGKSRLAREAQSRAQAQDMVVLHGRAHLDSVELAYAPIHEAFGRLLRGLPDKARTRLVTGLPDLARLFGELAGKTPPPIADPALERTRLFDAVAQLAERLAAESPLVIVIDDLQWADAASIGVLAHLARVGVSRLLVIATARGSLEGAAAQLAAQWRRMGAEEIVLGPLADAAVEALVAARLSGRVSPDVIARVRGRAGGVPLFAEQLVRAMVDAGQVIDAGAKWIVAAGAAPELPPAVRDLVEARLARLGPRERAVVDALAVAGDRADHATLAAATALPDPDLLGAAQELRRAGLVVEDEGGYALGHPLLAEVALAALPAEQRRRTHAAFARAVVDLDALARHLRGAGRDADPERTVDVLVAAGTRALARHANEQAVAHLGAAVAMCRAGHGAGRLGEVLEKIGEAWQRTGQAAAASDAWREAIALAPPERRASLHRRIAQIAWHRGRGDEVKAALAAAHAALPDAPPDERIAVLEVRLQAAERARDQAELGEVVRQLGDAGASSLALMATARFALAEHRLADATAAADQLLASATGELDQLRAAEAAAHVALERWRGDDAIGYSDTVERLARQLGEPASQMRGVGVRAAALLHAGRVDDCEKSALAAAELARRYDVSRGLVRTSVMLGWLALVRSRDADALQLFAASIEASERARGDHWCATTVALLAAGIALDGDGRVDPAPHVAALVSRGGDQWPFRIVLGGELAVRRGALDEALGLAAQLEATQDETIANAGAWIRAHVARARGEDPSELLARAARHVRPGMFRARLLVQQAELATGGVALAAAREASELADRLGMSRFGDRARKRLRELGVRPSTRRGGASGELSARELEVARAYAEGLSSAEVGERLSISPHTAATHLQKIYKRLGVASRAELTRWLIEQE